MGEGLMGTWRGRFILLAAVVAIGAAVLLPVAALGSKYGLWAWTTGFSIFTPAMFAAAGGAVASLIALILGAALAPRMGVGLAAAALVISAAAATPPVLAVVKARSLPLIHDITTDTADPPEFVAALDLRQEGENDAAYAGEEIAAQQREAYPDIAPVMAPEAPDEAFARAQRAAEAMGWALTDVNRAEGRIEAVDTTFWWGFKDDIVIRVREAEGGGARIDIRSASRVGLSDIGKNADRIRAYVKELEATA